MERKIGEIFEYKGEWYQCVGGTCRNCSCYYDSVCKNITTIGSTNFGNCHCSLRTDHKSVIFKKLEKVGKPYEYFIQGMGIIMVQEYILANANYIWEYNQDVVVMDCQNEKVAIEIKQNKEDMEENKLNLKPFDIQKAREGKPVCTRDGRKARIICFDAKRKDEKNIIALVPSKDYPGFEDLISYPNNGNYYGGHENDGDLMMLPEKKEGWINIVKTEAGGYCCKGEEVHSDYNDAILENINVLDKRGIIVKIEWEE